MQAPVQAGATVAGKYRVERVLGVGGMGVVVAAHDALLERRVAIKFLSDEGVQNPEAVARFAREARSAARIESEHVARVIEVGTLETGAPYMVMEYLDGSDLARRVSEHGPLPAGDAVDYVLQACEAIAEAHALGIVHRDLKPANLFLTRRADGSTFVKVLDFGISKAVAGSTGTAPELSLTKTAAVMGSPLYMAPEQMRSMRQVDARTDIWALGVILYELVSGRMPFEATTMPELCAMVLTDPPAPLREYCADVSPALVAVIERCLAKDPAQRFANLAELSHALALLAPSGSRSSAERISRVLGAAGIEVAPVLRADRAPDSARPGASTNAAWSPSSAPKHGVGGVRAAALGAFVLAGAVVLFVVQKRRLEPEPNAGSSAPIAAQATRATPLPTVAEPHVTPNVAEPRVTAPSAATPSAGVPSAATPSSVAPSAESASSAALKLRPPRTVANHPKEKELKSPKVAATQPAVATPPPAPAAPAETPKRNPLDVTLK